MAGENKVWWFDGYPVQVITGEPGRRGRLCFYYGGQGMPRGDGYGVVVSGDGVHYESWQLPKHEGGKVMKVKGYEMDPIYLRPALTQEEYDKLIEANTD